MEREIDRFDARSDYGYETTIVIMQKFIDVSHFGSQHAEEIPGVRRYVTINGLACNHIDDDTYEVVEDPLRPNLILRRIK